MAVGMKSSDGDRALMVHLCESFWVVDQVVWCLTGVRICGAAVSDTWTVSCLYFLYGCQLSFLRGWWLRVVV
jgi:hypothetical protein